MMKILISPAKTLDYTSDLPTDKISKISYGDISKKINKSLKNLSEEEIQAFMGISPKLATLNWQRNQKRNYDLETISEDVRQAIFAFKGDVYEGLDAYSLGDKDWDYMQQTLRILSGLYGILKPFDLIEPYRLEMGTKLQVGENKNLYEIWKPILAKKLQSEMKNGEELINLASNEYFSAIDKKAIKSRIITPEFKDYKDGKLKTISFFAKKARGMMARFVIENQLQSSEEIKKFDKEGYKFDASLSTKDKWIFTR